jgi:NAD(P)-dependent dehydrogenase (short-subunit alcohol dehydrogenase family)
MKLFLLAGAVLFAALVKIDPGGGFAGVGALVSLISDCVGNKHEWCDSAFPYIPPKVAVAMAFDRLEPTADKVLENQYGKEMHAMNDQVVIITGASSGLGYDAAKSLLKRGATVIMACRSVERGEKALKEFVDAGGVTGKGIVIEQDLSDLDSVESFVKKFKALDLPLHMLINNAGVMMRGYGVQQFSKQGHELHFAVNHLAHFHLTALLEDKLLSSGSKTNPSRAIYLTTLGLEFWRGADNDGHLSRQIPAFQHDNYHSFFGYINSKALNVITAREQQRRWAAKGGNAISFSVNPGLVGGYFSGCSADTPTMLDEAGAMKGAFYSWPFAHASKTPQQGASTLVYAAINPKIVDEVSGGAMHYDNNKVNTPGSLNGHPEWYTNEAVNLEAWKRTEAVLKERAAA